MPYPVLPGEPGEGENWEALAAARYQTIGAAIEDVQAATGEVAATAAAASAAGASLAPRSSPTFTGTVSGVTKGMVGLGNVDNTSDTAKRPTASQFTSGQLDGARLPTETAALRRRTAENEAQPTAWNWEPRPRFGTVIAVGQPPSPADSVDGDLHIGAVAEPLLPAQILDLRQWKVTLPVDSSGQYGNTRTAVEVKQPALATFTDPRHMRPAAGNVAVEFVAPVEGATTSGSEFPRCELREMTGTAGTTNASWGFNDGRTHEMTLTQAIVELPVAKPQIACGQIHDADNDNLIILADGFAPTSGNIAATGRSTIPYTIRWKWDGATQAVPLIEGYVTGEVFTVRVVVRANTMQLYADKDTVAYTLRATQNNLTSTFPASASSGCYFKAGTYAQSNTTNSGKTRPAALGGGLTGGDAPGVKAIVAVHSVTVTHSTATAQAPAPPTNVSATAGVNAATVTFTGSTGATSYTARASTGQTATGSGSPITVTGLPAGQPVTLTVTATNSAGTSAPSVASNTVYATEPGLSPVALNDGSTIPVYEGSSRFGTDLIGAVTVNNQSSAVYNAYTSAFPASKFLDGYRQAARNVCAILYPTGQPPRKHANLKLTFKAGPSIAYAYTQSSELVFEEGSIGASVTASYTTHEVVHLFGGAAPSYGSNAEITGLVEGIADYVLIRLGYHNRAAHAPRDGGGNWSDGYRTTSFFLDYVAHHAPTPTPDFVPRLNAALNTTSWNKSAITSLNARGMTVDALWAEYKAWLGYPLAQATLPFTDRTNVAFTGAGQTSNYHAWASGRKPGDPILVWLHGDGAYEHNNPTSNYVFGGSNGVVAQAKARGYIVISAKSPDTTGSITWWESGNTRADYLKALVDSLKAGYAVNPRGVVLAGFSGGAQQVTQFFMGRHPEYLAQGGGTIVFGGGEAPDVTPTYSSQVRQNIFMYWAAGSNDTAANASDGFDGRGAATYGEQWFRGKGFTRTLIEIQQGQGHTLNNFGLLVGKTLDNNPVRT